MATEQRLNTIVINKVENKAVYDNMLSRGLVKDDEFYLVDDSEEIKVKSVNGNTPNADGDVTLTASDVGALASDGKAVSAGVADSANSVAWGNVQGKPDTFAPSTHNHDDRYYTESETNALLNNKANSSDLNNYLSTSGGTLSGDITVNSWQPAVIVKFKGEGNILNDTELQLLIGSSGKAGLYDGTQWLLWNEHANRKAFYLAETPATDDNSDRIATTSFVKSQTALAGYSQGTRLGTANLPTSTNGVGRMFTFLATSGMKTGKPPWDCSIIQANWDTSGGWDSQLAFCRDGIAIRGQDSGTWGDWKQASVIDSSGTKYIRYTNGMQICWGSTYISFDNSTMASNSSTFPQPFKQIPMISGTNASGSYTYSFEISVTLTATACSFMAVNRGGAITVTNREIYWIAIGQWK